MSPAKKYSMLPQIARHEVLRLVRGGLQPVKAVELMFAVAAVCERRRHGQA